MATDQHFVDYVLEQAGLGDALASRRMFGEFGLYLDGVFVAVAADNMLFLKPTGAARELLATVLEAPPYPGARPWFVVDDALDDPELLRRLLRTTVAALPPPRAKSASRAASSAGASSRRATRPHQ
ncbi:TfoX/Sxy family protein [Pseudoxanthomonas suwonensis]|uniref:TfoX/Sxy family protein n=1 Tax=Pseudoxanthomonas suwonensis TaxID=314722 RepID=UPI0004B75DB0|nr:TfoX/Sxy family protein [Pseudoxanthomonas suwonensis]